MTRAIWIMRNPNLPPVVLNMANKALGELGGTVYKRTPLEEAPVYTDCITGLYYYYHMAYSLQLPIVRIGDLPRYLRCHSWQLLQVGPNDLQDSDLVFVKHIKYEQYVRHVAWAIDHMLYHVSNAGLVHVGVEDFMKEYEQPRYSEFLLRYIDPRNHELRGLHNSEFISEQCSVSLAGHF